MIYSDRKDIVTLLPSTRIGKGLRCLVYDQSSEGVVCRSRDLSVPTHLIALRPLDSLLKSFISKIVYQYILL